MWPMMFNYSVMDCDLKPQMPYHFIAKSQQTVALMAVRRELDSELELYIANDTLETQNVKYTVTAYDKSGNTDIVDYGTITQEKNSVSCVKALGKQTEPKLLVIEWEQDGKIYFNHAFTSFADYETMKEWLKIISKVFGLEREMLELK